MMISSVSSKDLSTRFSKVAQSLDKTAHVVNAKVQEVARLIFKYILDLIKTLENFCSEKNPEALDEESGFFQGIMKQAFSKVENKKEPKQELAIVEVSQPMTYAYELAMVAAPIFLAVNAQFSGNFSFMQEQLTLQAETEALQSSIKSFFGNNLDPKVLQSHSMVLKSKDSIDHAVFQFGMLSVATLTHAATGNLCGLPLHPLFTVMAAMPPVENAVMSLEFPKLISKRAHELHSAVRKAATGFIKPYVARIIKPKLLSLAEKADTKVQKRFTAKDSYDLGHFGNTLLKATVQQTITEPVANFTAQTIDLATTKAAEGVFDLCLNRIGKVAFTAVQVGLMDKAMKTAYMHSPLLVAASWVIGGGVKQPLDQLALRVAGASLFFVTGQTVWPILLVYGPSVVKYFVELKKTYDSVNGQGNKSGKKGPVVETGKNVNRPKLLNKNLAPLAFREKPKPMNEKLASLAFSNKNIVIAASGKADI